MLILTFALLVGLITALVIKWEPVGKDVEREEEVMKELQISECYDLEI